MGWWSGNDPSTDDDDDNNNGQARSGQWLMTQQTAASGTRTPGRRKPTNRPETAQHEVATMPNRCTHLEPAATILPSGGGANNCEFAAGGRTEQQLTTT